MCRCGWVRELIRECEAADSGFCGDFVGRGEKKKESDSWTTGVCGGGARALFSCGHLDAVLLGGSGSGLEIGRDDGGGGGLVLAGFRAGRRARR